MPLQSLLTAAVTIPGSSEEKPDTAFLFFVNSEGDTTRLSYYQSLEGSTRNFLETDLFADGKIVTVAENSPIGAVSFEYNNAHNIRIYYEEGDVLREVISRNGGKDWTIGGLGTDSQSIYNIQHLSGISAGFVHITDPKDTMALRVYFKQSVDGEYRYVENEVGQPNWKIYNIEGNLV